MSRAHRHPRMPEDVPFPVTPMLDMAFQLLAFFVLTFQPPTRETRIDLYLPAVPAALPTGGGGRTVEAPAEAEPEMENNLVLRARADAGGRLSGLVLSGEPIPGGIEELGGRLRHYASLLKGEPLRVRLVADDSLSYDEAAKLLGTLELSGVASIRLAGPGTDSEKAP